MFFPLSLHNKKRWKLFSYDTATTLLKRKVFTRNWSLAKTAQPLAHRWTTILLFFSLPRTPKARLPLFRLQFEYLSVGPTGAGVWTLDNQPVALIWKAEEHTEGPPWMLRKREVRGREESAGQFIALFQWILSCILVSSGNLLTVWRLTCWIIQTAFVCVHWNPCVSVGVGSEKRAQDFWSLTLS